MDLKNIDDNRLRIVLNYLTGSGFRSGIIHHPEIKILRDGIRAEIVNRVQFHQWSLYGVDIRDVVKDPRWQSLRKSFLGTWKKTPVENVEKLRKFLEETG